jgi:DNA segregation ATPase FtsK/SpoIIIE-like protein
MTSFHIKKRNLYIAIVYNFYVSFVPFLFNAYRIGYDVAIHLIDETNRLSHFLLLNGVISRINLSCDRGRTVLMHALSSHRRGGRPLRI